MKQSFLRVVSHLSCKETPRSIEGSTCFQSITPLLYMTRTILNTLQTRHVLHAAPVTAVDPELSTLIHKLNCNRVILNQVPCSVVRPVMCVSEAFFSTFRYALLQANLSGNRSSKLSLAQ
jgi:hypothetical protein